jgi:molybdenum cofactor cytidylyltransferase
VLGSTVRHAIETQLPVLVVTTAARVALLARQLATRDIVVLADGEAANGMGHSIAAGVAERSGAPGWLVLPGDMPLVRPGTILAVAGALEQHPVVYAQYRGRRGHPVGFAAELYSELIMLRGDDGARRILARYPSHGQEVDDPGVLLDVDTASDLEALRQAVTAPQGAAP